jgi:Flp pilus assembly protein TadD
MRNANAPPNRARKISNCSQARPGRRQLGVETLRGDRTLVQSALRQNPNDATARNDLGLSFYLRSPRDSDRVIAAHRDALKIDPRHGKSLRNHTQALIDKGAKAAADGPLKRLEEVNPDNQAIAPLGSQAQ